jgi:hypothetical protein
MARKSGWQEFAENFNSTFEIGNKIQQGIATSKVMNDEKFTGEGGAGYNLSGSELEKARYKALGDIYTKYGDPEKGLGFRTQLAGLESADRENTINNRILEELIQQRGSLKTQEMEGNNANTVANTGLANANANRVTGLTPLELEKAKLTNKQLGFNLQRGQALLPGEVTARELQNNSLAIGNNTSTFNLDAAKQKLPAQLEQLDANIKATLESANLNATSANRVNALLNGEIALNKANVDGVIASTGLKGAQAEELRALLLGKVELQGLDAEAKRVANAENNLKYNIAYETKEGNVSALRAQYAGQVAEAKKNESAADLEQLSTDAFRSFATNQKSGMYKTDKESTDAYMEIVKMFDPAKAADLAQKYNENEIQKIATDGALYQAEVSAYVQKGDLDGIKQFFDDQNGTATGVELDEGPDKKGPFRMYEVDADGNQVSLIMEAPDKAEALARLEQLTTYGNAANFSEKLFARRKDEASMKNTEAQTKFTLKNLKYLTGRDDLTQAQADLATQRANEIRSAVRAASDGTTAGLAKDAADQKAVDQFITKVTIASLLDPDRVDVPTLVADFIKNRQASGNAPKITITPE